ncbi:MAG: phosphodiesterase [Clostridia bacterium]|nr:phosphodiesterase [Clostridia bacterium]
MKFLIASDIHGSALYCRKLLEAFALENADRLILLGDILYHGPRNDLPEEYAPKEVIRMLNGLKGRVFSVRGNCEAEVDQMVLDFPISAESILIPICGKLVFAAHGHQYNGGDMPPLSAGDVFLCGHTHVPSCVERDGIFVLNAGSVSLPKEGAPHSYMTLENGVFSWKTMDGEVFDVFII